MLMIFIIVAILAGITVNSQDVTTGSINSTMDGNISVKSNASSEFTTVYGELKTDSVSPYTDAETKVLNVTLSENNEETKNLKVLVSSKDFPESGLKILEEHFTVHRTPYSNYGVEGSKENHDELLKLIPGCSALIWVSNLEISNELVYAAGRSLKVVATTSVGHSHCNGYELKKRHIQLANTPNVLNPAIAELAVGLILAAARRFKENLQQIVKGKWQPGTNKLLGVDLRNSTVGIIGFGEIGQAIAKRLAGFEVAKFLCTGHNKTEKAKAVGAQYVTLDSLLTESDFVVLSTALTDETRNMINDTSLARMKKNAILVNVGRGELIDQKALYRALKNKKIYGAALDGTVQEPLPPNNRLLRLPNLFILPHIGSATERTRSDMAVLAANNVVNALTGKPLITPVPLDTFY